MTASGQAQSQQAPVNNIGNLHYQHVSAALVIATNSHIFPPLFNIPIFRSQQKFSFQLLIVLRTNYNLLYKYLVDPIEFDVFPLKCNEDIDLSLLNEK